MEWNNNLKPKNMMQKSQSLLDKQLGIANKGNDIVNNMTNIATNAIANKQPIKFKKKGFMSKLFGK